MFPERVLDILTAFLYITTAMSWIAFYITGSYALIAVLLRRWGFNGLFVAIVLIVVINTTAAVKFFDARFRERHCFVEVVE